MSEKIEDLEARRQGHSLARIRAALEGRFDAGRLDDSERAIFNDLLGAAMDGTHTVEARAFWATFDNSPNTDESCMSNADFQHLLQKARDARVGGRDAWGVQSTGERLAVALVLNRFDWLQAMGYTIAEAIERVGPQWANTIPEVAKILRDETPQ